jgi:hypothetical protein
VSEFKVTVTLSIRGCASKQEAIDHVLDDIGFSEFYTDITASLVTNKEEARKIEEEFDADRCYRRLVAALEQEGYFDDKN